MEQFDELNIIFEKKPEENPVVLYEERLFHGYEKDIIREFDESFVNYIPMTGTKIFYYINKYLGNKEDESEKYFDFISNYDFWNILENIDIDEKLYFSVGENISEDILKDMDIPFFYSKNINSLMKYFKSFFETINLFSKIELYEEKKEEDIKLFIIFKVIKGYKISNKLVFLYCGILNGLLKITKKEIRDKNLIVNKDRFIYSFEYKEKKGFFEKNDTDINDKDYFDMKSDLYFENYNSLSGKRSRVNRINYSGIINSIDNINSEKAKKSFENVLTALMISKYMNFNYNTACTVKDSVLLRNCGYAYLPESIFQKKSGPDEDDEKIIKLYPVFGFFSCLFNFYEYETAFNVLNNSIINDDLFKDKEFKSEVFSVIEISEKITETAYELINENKFTNENFYEKIKNISGNYEININEEISEIIALHIRELYGYNIKEKIFITEKISGFSAGSDKKLCQIPDIKEVIYDVADYLSKCKNEIEKKKNKDFFIQKINWISSNLYKLLDYGINYNSIKEITGKFELIK
ncbi:MAG: hypothetical protein H7A30_07855 [Thermotogae bacterium]|nr:hypothetical protein [Thermotogota bacterium]